MFQAIHKAMNCKQFQEQVHEDSETNADARRTREMLEVGSEKCVLIRFTIEWSF